MNMEAEPLQGACANVKETQNQLFSYDSFVQINCLLVCVCVWCLQHDAFLIDDFA